MMECARSGVIFAENKPAHLSRWQLVLSDCLTPSRKL